MSIAKTKTIAEINSKVHYDNTAKALVKCEKDIKGYRELIQKNQQIYRNSETNVEDMMKLASRSLENFQKLIEVMGASQEGYINNGDIPPGGPIFQKSCCRKFGLCQNCGALPGPSGGRAQQQC